ncbi:MAG TPA: hypothetical protein VK845_12565 [Gemmatimonadales bacterium]|nr:hypothetical protein [Gemmatimonadales bacterium]
MQDPPVQLGDIVVVGGGCYGTFYTQQLIDARQRNKATYGRLVVVDRDPACHVRHASADGYELVVEDWDAFFDRYLGDAADGTGTMPANSMIVPSPLMPHLMYRWLLRRARSRWPERAVQTAPLGRRLGTPYESTAPDLTQYVSFADWLCPTHCIEPSTCPVIRAPRTWEMGEALGNYVRTAPRAEHVNGPVLFVCRHQVHGVGAFAVDEVVAGDQRVAEAGADAGPVDIIVGTISACHGAVNRLRIGLSEPSGGSGNR